MTSGHTFHIPVMGTGFTIDTPLRVARFGIDSEISIMDDRLMERMRKHYSAQYGIPYNQIPDSGDDVRAKRITAYLDMMQDIIQLQMLAMRRTPLDQNYEALKYFSMLDADSDERLLFERWKQGDTALRRDLEKKLWVSMRPGAIEVNIMTKVDHLDEKRFAPDKKYSDAMASLRGFAASNLQSTVVFSAGLNLRLYDYATEFDDFIPDAQGRIAKKIALKVSDFRSASVQAKIFSKKGIWVSEFRIESGLNCGGHAFPTDGMLMGPVLEEFKQKKEGWLDSLFVIFNEALYKTKGYRLPQRPRVKFSAQGGVGTSNEHRMLLRQYELDSIGWGSPFLLVPEATCVDENTLQKLEKAEEEDIYLSNASPLGVPFYNLRNSDSEISRREKIKNGHPGSPCFYHFLAMNTEFGEPLCPASSRYQSQKIEALKTEIADPEILERKIDRVTDKACICYDLGMGAVMSADLVEKRDRLTPAICPGPNLAYFSSRMSLQQMVAHIYGRTDVLDRLKERPHVFIKEIQLYIKYFKEKMLHAAPELRPEWEAIEDFKKNILKSIQYYKELCSQLKEETESARQEFLRRLHLYQEELNGLA